MYTVAVGKQIDTHVMERILRVAVLGLSKQKTTEGSMFPSLDEKALETASRLLFKLKGEA